MTINKDICAAEHERRVWSSTHFLRSPADLGSEHHHLTILVVTILILAVITATSTAAPPNPQYCQHLLWETHAHQG